MAVLVLSKGLSGLKGLAVLVLLAVCLPVAASFSWLSLGSTTIAMVACSLGALAVSSRLRGHGKARTAEDEKDTLLELLRVLASAVEVKNAADFNHVERVAQIAEKLAGSCNLDAQASRELRIASYVHDIGKLGIPTQTLHRQAPPSIDEWELIRNHSAIGAALLSESGMDRAIIETVRYHHEHWDGSGYPEGLAGCNIPLSARILSLADACDALLSPRPSRGGFSIEETRSILQKESARKYDPQLVGQLLNLFEKGEIPVFTANASATCAVGPRAVFAAADGGYSGALGDAVCGIGASEGDEGGAGGIRLAQCQNIEEAMKVIAPAIRSLAPYAALVCYTLEERTGTITARYAEGVAAEQLRQNTLQKGQGISGWAVANNQDIVANHAEMDFRAETEQERPQFKCAAVFNLASEGDPQTSFGAITLYLDRPELMPQGIRLRLKNLASRISGRLEKLATGKSGAAAALSDPITHLPTLNLLYSHATHELAQARRHSYAVAFVETELENYREILQQHGQEESEKFLRELARAIRRYLRDGDILARISESEFAGIFPMTTPSQAQFLLRRLRSCTEYFHYQTAAGINISPQMTFGCASFPEHGKTCESLFLKANTHRFTDKMQTGDIAAEAGSRRSGKVIPFRP